MPGTFAPSLRLVALLLLGLVCPLALAAGGGAMIFGHAPTQPTDRKVLQEGARLYFNYCAGCHSLKYVRYSSLAADLELEEALVMEHLNFTGAKAGDFVLAAMPSAKAVEWFGQAPPDLSLTARSRGTDWIYNYLLSFYPDPSRPLGWNNTVFPNASMPHVLADREGVKSASFSAKGKDGHCRLVEINNQCFESFGAASGGSLSPQAYRAEMAKLTSFLEYVGEPAILKRESLGVWVLLYLALFTFVAWLLKSEYWKDVH